MRRLQRATACVLCAVVLAGTGSPAVYASEFNLDSSSVVQEVEGVAVVDDSLGVPELNEAGSSASDGVEVSSPELDYSAVEEEAAAESAEDDATDSGRALDSEAKDQSQVVSVSNSDTASQTPAEISSSSEAEPAKGGWLESNGDWYYYDENGNACYGWLSVEGMTYYLDPDTGARVQGWLELGGKRYRLDWNDGHLWKSSWFTVSGRRYYATEDGSLVLGWLDLDGRRYRMDKNKGYLWTGWYNADGAWYYGDPDDGGAVDTAGGWREIGGRTYYLKPGTGARVQGWLSVGGKRYRLDKNNGRLWTGWFTVDGKRYYANDDGSLYKGWLSLGGKRYRMDKNYYYARVGWFTVSGGWYYGSSDGSLLTGTHKIDGVSYTFDKNGKSSKAPLSAAMSRKAQSYSSSTNWLIMIDTKNNYIGIFKGKKGNWQLSKYWQCSTGASSTPTILGQYTVGAKGYSFGSGYTCYYYTQFCGDYLIHSIKYYQGTFNVLDGRLGMNISHGCVRLPLERAKWVYNNIPRGTKVVTYR